MAQKNINVLEIIKKIMTDPRFINVVSEILNDISNDAPKSVARVTAKPEKAPIDWASKSDATLRAAYAYRKKHNLAIEPELNDILANRFHGYDSEQQIFTGRRQKQPTTSIEKPEQPAKAKPIIDWTAKSDATLRAAYAYRKKHNLAIEPELNDILANRFHGYDSEQQIFTGRRQKQPTTSIEKPEQPAKAKPIIDWTAKSDATLRAAYTYRKKHNLAIEPELNDILADRFAGYDAEKMQFMGRKVKQKPKKVRVINWAEKTDDILRQAYKHRCNTPDGIDDELNVELALRFPDEYDQTTRTFLKKPKIQQNSGTKQVQKSANSIQRPTTATTAAKPKATTPTTLTVTLKLVKQSLDATYNNVYVNGNLILRNHANTKLEILGDGTLLAVHGIVTDNKNLPQRPLIMIYDTNLVANKWAGRDKIAGYDIYAKYINPTADGLNVTLSNKCTIILNNERLKRLAGITRFEIER